MGRSPILWIVLGVILIGAVLVGWRLPSPPDVESKPAVESVSPAPLPLAAPAVSEPAQTPACIQYNWRNGSWVCTQTASLPTDATPEN